MIQILVNGISRETRAGTVAQLLQELEVPGTGVAVAVNESVVRRAEHASFALQEADKVEIIRAVQGG